MMNWRTNRRPVVDLVDLAPDFLRLNSSVEIRRRILQGGTLSGRFGFSSLNIDCRKCLMIMESARTDFQQGLDHFGQDFLPWCLARGADLAVALSIPVITVVCDSQTWKTLEPTRSLLTQIAPDILIKHKPLWFHPQNTSLAPSTIAS